MNATCWKLYNLLKYRESHVCFFLAISNSSSVHAQVIAAMVKQAKKASAQQVPWAYDCQRQVTQDSGAGNNWAHGYHDYGPKCQESILDAIRLEVTAKNEALILNLGR
jgi:hypothetical protein